jgi:hypothetical protein
MPTSRRPAQLPQTSHESICVLNDAERVVVFTVTAYFADRDPEQLSMAIGFCPETVMKPAQ